MAAARLEREKQTKIELLIRKRTSFENQVASLQLEINSDNIDLESLNLRGNDVQKLFERLLEFHDELALLEPNVDHVHVLTTIQTNYYAVMSQLKRKLAPKDVSINNQNPPSASISRQEVKLPEIPLPKFNGKYEEWFTFKDSFTAIIDKNDKINEVSKLFALKKCLVDEAQAKVDIYREVPGEYEKAWKYLEKSYEVKRLIAESHLQAIDNLPILEKETNEGLTKLIDGLTQHRTCLERLGITIHPTVAVHILQSKLPKYTLKKWEESINLEDLPSLDNLIDFISRIAVCASRKDKRPNSTRVDSVKQQPLFKRGRFNSNKPVQQVFTTNVSNKCPACKGERHPLYRCEKFKTLNIKERLEIVKRNNLCKNCLRFHKGACYLGPCKNCNEKHNNLLHCDSPNKEKKESEHANQENSSGTQD